MKTQTEQYINETDRYKTVIDRINLLGPGLLKFFKNDKKVRKKYRIEDPVVFRKICRTIWIKVARDLVEVPGGVVLDKFGYLTHWRTPVKRIYKHNYCTNLSKIYTNEHTDGFFYNTALFTQVVDSNNGLKGWSMDKTVSSKIKRAMAKKLKSGMKYKFYYTLIHNLYRKNDKEVNIVKREKTKKWL